MPHEMATLARRDFLRLTALGVIGTGLAPEARAAAEPADYTLRIANGLVELAPTHIVSTTLYDGQFPGRLLRFKEGRRVSVDVVNDTDTPELVHWHGMMIASDVDGATEKARRSFRRTARAAYRSCRNPRAFVSIIHTSAPAPT